jgi:hypothetical protein
LKGIGWSGRGSTHRRRLLWSGSDPRQKDLTLSSSTFAAWESWEISEDAKDSEVLLPVIVIVSGAGKLKVGSFSSGVNTGVAKKS